MKKTLYLSLSLFLCISIQHLSAQNVSAIRMLKANVSNANKLFEAFFTPANKAIGASLNNGWHNTAETHGLGKFDIRFPLINLSFAKSDERTFNANNLGLTDVTISGTESQTILGKDAKGQTLSYTPQGRNLTSFEMPEGLGFPFAPTLMMQANIGLPKGTEVMLRFFPKIAIDDVKVGIFGAGIKHNFKQWIRGMNLWPIDFALAFGYTSANIDYSVLLQPDVDGNGQVLYPTGALPVSAYENQKLAFKVNAYNIAFLVSKKLLAVTFYGGVRYDKSKTNLKTVGVFPISVLDAGMNPVTQNFTNPLSFDTEISQVALTGGVRLRATFFSIFADGTLSKYSNLSFGIGFGSFNKF